jgi:Predicted nucleoside-diphosphate sugar epimerases
MNNDIILKILGRDKELFLQDYKHSQEYLKNIISNSKIIVLGGAGSIGSYVVLELLKYNPFLLHIVDIEKIISRC